ncbi:unnamed protein product [Thlaspi arvense]|uniref:NB-ARC domain-containing protein n=1 Tax=Thlaspi arvense TaxID=13288 RepID=A0AAU9RG87_THLAR|nr:unnamed protein product [Thlaspi arvense]
MGNCVSLHMFGDGNRMHMMGANLEALQKAMQELKERRDDLLRRVVTEEEDEGLQRLAQVQGWFSRVEGVESKVNHLLETRSTQTKSLCLCGYCSLNSISGCYYGRKVMRKLNEVKGLLSNGVFETVAEKITAPKAEKKHIPTSVGLETQVKKAWNRLMKDGQKRTLGLHGIGGIGKTTLLAGINNKCLEEIYGFDVVIWVVVSKNLQYQGIQDQILRRLDLDKEWEQETEEQRAYAIYNILNEKKFVLLLDDLWSKVDLTRVGVPPVTQENGSKIVFTTRSKEVCTDMEADEVMEVVCLESFEAYLLFQRRVGNYTLDSHQGIFELSRKVARKCKGLPLALNTVGASMAYKETVKEWKDAIDALSFPDPELLLLTEEKTLVPLLKFSFDNLRDKKVKLCFLYCSLFPEEIEKNELIEYWVREGFVDGKRDEDGTNKQGDRMIALLLGAHLLMDGEVSTRVKVHDVVREMAFLLATYFANKKEIFCFWSHRVPKDISSKDARWMSLMSNQITELSCSPKCPKLLTLILRDNKLVDIPGEFFRFMPALVSLDLSENKSLVGLPDEISSLGFLQYLNLSHTGIKSLPAGIKELRRLMELDLNFTPGLESIAGISTSIPDLEVLKLLHSGVCIDEGLMKELQVMEHLKVLKATIEDAVVLESVQGMVRLASCIQTLCIRKMSAPVVILNTVALSGLEHLAVVKCKLSEIEIDGKSKESKEILPCTSAPPSFKQLTGIHIGDLEGPRDLTWLVFAQNLRYLVVKESSSIQEIINTEKAISICNAHPSIAAPFGKLEHFKLSGMAELEIIGRNPRALPCLKEFIVLACPKLPLSLRDRTKNNVRKVSEKRS